LGNMMLLSTLSPDEEYKSGAYEYINELHAKAGLHYVGRATAMSKPQYFWMITNKNIKRPQELAGQKIAASSTWPAPFLKAVGATPVLVPVPEFYTGLERGVVDGAADPLTNFMTFQLYEVCKYVIEPGVFTGGLVMIMNLGTWNKLPEDMKKLINDVGAQVLREYTVDMDKEVLKAKNTAQEKGMGIIRFAPEDEKWFIDTFYEASWKENTSKYPDIAPKMKKLMSRESLR
jgi:TRAP-type transport system periplasmic protein